MAVVETAALFDSMGMVLIAGLTLFVLPAFVHFFRKSEGIAKAVDAFVLVTVLGIIATEILPSLIAEESIFGFALFALGIFLPSAAERLLASSRMALAIAVIPLFVFHCAFDGAAIASAENVGLVTALLIHRLPAGLLVYLVTRERWSALWAFVALGVFALATLAGGVFAGEWLLGHWQAHDAGALYIEAMLGGALTHVLFHMGAAAVVKAQSSCHSVDTADESSGCGSSSAADGEQTSSCGSTGTGMEPTPSCHGNGEVGKSIFDLSQYSGIPDLLGLIGGITVLTLLRDIEAGAGAGNIAHGHHGGELSVFGSFMELALDSSFALCVAYVLGGLLYGFFPQAAVAWLKRGRFFLQSLKGVLFGLPLPICSCGVLPLYETIARKGVPAAAGLAFLVATPELGLDAILLSVPLLGTEFTLFRVLAAFILALSVGLILGRFIPAHKQACELNEKESSLSELGFWERLGKSLRYGMTDLVDNTMPWVLVGLAIAAICAPALSAELFEDYPEWIQVPLFGLIGIPVYVCASGATPIAAVAMLKGISPGAVLAFLLTGPATNVTTFGVLRNLHGRNAAVLFALFVGLGSIVLGILVNEFYVGEAAAGEAHLHESGLLEKACLGMLCMLGVYGTLRKGLRGFFQKVISPH